MMTYFKSFSRMHSSGRRLVPIALLAAGATLAAAGVTRANDGTWTFPYAGSISSSGGAFDVDNGGSGWAGQFRASNQEGASAAVYAFSSGFGPGPSAWATAMACSPTPTRPAG